jgi:hypothetical protein
MNIPLLQTHFSSRESAPYFINDKVLIVVDEPLNSIVSGHSHSLSFVTTYGNGQTHELVSLTCSIFIGQVQYLLEVNEGSISIASSLLVASIILFGHSHDFLPFFVTISNSGGHEHKRVSLSSDILSGSEHKHSSSSSFQNSPLGHSHS